MYIYIVYTYNYNMYVNVYGYICMYINANRLDF